MYDLRNSRLPVIVVSHVNSCIADDHSITSQQNKARAVSDDFFFIFLFFDQVRAVQILQEN